MSKSGSARIGFRVWLLVLTLFACLPMLLFSVISLGMLMQSQGEVERNRLSRAATALAGTLERHLAARASMLAAIVSSPAAKNGDMKMVYAHAKRIVEQYPRFSSITLADTEGTILFSTLQPLGTHLPKTQDMELLRRVLETRQPQVSGVFQGTISHRKVTVLGVVLTTNTGKRYCLENVLPVAELEVILAQQHFSDIWSSAIFGRGEVIACHGPIAVGYGGSLGAPRGEGGAAATEHLCEPQAGDLVETALANVGNWGWTVAVSVPERAFAAPLHWLLLKFGIVGALCLLAAIAASLWLASRLSRDVTRLAMASAAMTSSGQPAFDEGIIIREMGEVRACLLAAHEREEQAMHDPLTGLAGRARFWELARELEREARDPQWGLAILFIDLDGFKHVNDRHGHERGDWILQHTAAAVHASIRDKDVAGRLGGDEFAVCLSAARTNLRQAATAIAERIVGKVRYLGYGIGCSIGVALCQDCTPTLTECLKVADQAMYEAKRLGKNRYAVREVTGSPVPACKTTAP